tara:strand:- start:1290 stop:2393 length:1104 start_codon:yes stop_codon:yes gene_type:complete
MNSKIYIVFLITIFLAFSFGFAVNSYEIFPYSIIKDVYIETQKIPYNESYENDVYSLIHIRSMDSKIEVKNNLNHFIWKQESLPTYEPDLIENNITDKRYSNMKNLDSIDKFVINMEYDVNSIAYFFKPSDSNNKLIIYHQGHKGDFHNGKNVIQYFLEKNYSVLAFSMPLLGMNSQPVIDNSYTGKTKLQSHNQLELLENENFTPIKFFIEPIIVSINYLENNYDYSSYHIVGISGGGWTATLAGAIDDRILQTYSIAGSYPFFLRSDPENFGDYEQHNLALYEKSNYLDLYVMASIGDERKFIQIFNKYDPCCFGGDSFQKYENEIKNVVNEIGKGSFNIYLDDTHREHIISNNALEIIISEISD